MAVENIALGINLRKNKNSHSLAEVIAEQQTPDPDDGD